MTNTVFAAHYGLGTIFPAIPVDDQPNWNHPGPGSLPTRTTDGRELLTLRWSSPAPADEQALQALVHAARRAPEQPLGAGEVAAYAAALPEGVRLITLRPTALLGPWHSRPGAQTTQSH